MKRTAQGAIVIVAAVAGLAAGIYAAMLGGRATSAKALADAVYAVTLPDPQMRQQSLGQWRERTLLVNFWATWCAPCREEIPGLIRLQSRYSAKNLQIV